MQKYLNNKQGAIYIQTCFLIIIILMIFSLLLEYAMVTVLVKGQRKSAMQILDKYTQNNAIKIYDSIKICKDTTDSLEPDLFIEALCQAQGLETLGNEYIAYSSEQAERFKVSEVTMRFIVKNTTNICVAYTLTVPLKFMSNIVWVDIPVEITTKLVPKMDITEM